MSYHGIICMTYMQVIFERRGTLTALLGCNFLFTVETLQGLKVTQYN